MLVNATFSSRNAGLRVCLVVTRLLLAVTGSGLESCLVSATFKLESQQRESGLQRVHS